MQEMIYLSDRKLAQFLPSLRSAWPRPRISLSTPFGGMEVDTATTAAGRDPHGRHLARVVRRIEESARWYAEDGLRPGQWVAFEASLNYLVLRTADTDMVLFVDVPAAEPDTRLLLHGSVEHLIAAGHRSAADEVGGSDALAQVLLGTGASAPGALLSTLSEDLAAEGNGRQPSLITALRRLLERLDMRTHPEMAACMRGYARITTGFMTDNGPGLVVASPLYVEFNEA
ncbi:MAG: hypothetical protein HOY75_24495 [Streptomyces sp.]|nr:hypothetical protein [Streptomyces sp.]